MDGLEEMLELCEAERDELIDGDAETLAEGLVDILEEMLGEALILADWDKEILDEIDGDADRLDEILGLADTDELIDGEDEILEL
jgi:hypothetical protein